MTRIALCCGSSEFLSSIHRSVSDEFTAREIDGLYIDEFLSGRSLLLYHKLQPYDVVFLDIDTPEIAAPDLAKELSGTNNRCCTVFISRRSEIISDGLYFSPLSFVINGGDELIRTKLHDIADQLLYHLRQNKNIVLENKEQGRRSVCIKDILYVESDRHYIIYHISDRKQTFRVRGSIGKLQEQLVKYDFFRVHKQYLVNLRHIFNINKTSDTVVFNQGFELPMSRNRKADVNEKLTEYLKRQ